MISDNFNEKMEQLEQLGQRKRLLAYQASLMQADNYPIYRRGKATKIVVKFIRIKTGYVVESGNTHHIVGTLHTDWLPHTHDCWEPYDYESTTNSKTPDQLVLFETTNINSTTTITKVPNGYVMTSHSGHQVLIPTNSI